MDGKCAIRLLNTALAMPFAILAHMDMGQGLLEIMGLVDEEEVGDSVEGWLTAEQVFERWQKHWLENHSGEGA